MAGKIEARQSNGRAATLCPHPPRSLARLLALCCSAGAAAGLAAETPTPATYPQVWLNPGLYSYHLDRNKGHRDNNIGFGGEVAVRADHVVFAGTFVNSDGARTRYGAYEWRPLHWRLAGLAMGAGIIIGAFDGYPRYRNGGWFVAPMPAFAVEGRRLGLNVAIIPTIPDRVSGAISFQVKLRVW
jgi:hypothetical protein